MQSGGTLAATETAIPGLVLFDLPVHGDSRGWFKEDWQREKVSGHDPARVTGVTTEEHYASSSRPVAPRPRNSTLDLTKIEAVGFTSPDWRTSLATYLAD